MQRLFSEDYNFIVLTRTGKVMPTMEGVPVPDIIEIDLLSDDSCAQLSAEFAMRPPIHALINAAADTNFHMYSHEILGRQGKAFDQLSLNVVGPAICAASLFDSQWKDRPLEREGVSILNISSISGSQTFFGTRQCFYAASKAAINMMTLYMSNEYKPFNIKVNAMSPGRFENGNQAEKVAHAAKAILESSFTGKVYDLSMN